MAKKEALHVRKQFSGNLSVIASDVTLRQWKCAEQGNEDLCGITLLLHDSTTLEDSLSVTTTPTPAPHPLTLYICEKNFSSRLWGNTCYMLIQGRCEEQRCCWSHWDCGAADVSSWQSCDLEHLRVLVLLEPCFQLVFFLTGVFDVLCRHRDWLVLLVMSWGTLSTGLLLESVIKKKSYFPLYN